MPEEKKKRRCDPAPTEGVYPEHRSGQAQLRVLGKGMRTKTRQIEKLKNKKEREQKLQGITNSK